MGFDAIFLGRISDQDRNARKLYQTMEHIWNASPRNLGSLLKVCIYTITVHFDLSLKKEETKKENKKKENKTNRKEKRRNSK